MTDLSIPGRGFPFRFVRTYRSGSTYDGPLGFGWDFNYNARLQKTGKEIVRFDGTGRKDIYSLDGDVYISPPGFYDRLEQQDDNTLTITDKNGTVQEYRLTGEFYRLMKVTDRNGNQVTLSYNESDQLTTITDTLGRQITVNYDDGRIVSLEDFAGRRISFAYDTQGNLISFTTPATDRYPGGNTFSYAYLSNHNLVSITDPKGQTFLQNSYDRRDRVVEQVYGSSTQKFTYGYLSGETIETDRNGNVRHYEYDTNGNLTLFTQFVQDSDSLVTSYEYNDNMEITKIIFPRGNSIERTYDISNPDPLQRGNLLEVRKKSHIDGESDLITNFTYEPLFNQVKTVTDPMGNTTTNFYDYEEGTLGDLNGDGQRDQSVGNLVKIQYPISGIERKFWYNDFGQEIREIHPEGNVAAKEYYEEGPSAGYPKSEIVDFSALGLTTTFTYDLMGNITSVTNPNGNTITFEFNALNQIVKEISPAPFNYEKLIYYDLNGNLERMNVQNVDHDGTIGSLEYFSTVYTYDILNNKLTEIKTVDAEKSVTTSFTYDANENLVEIIQPIGNVEKIEYDARNLVHKRIRGFGTEEASTVTTNYDENGNVKETIDGEGHITTFSYDGFDRLRRKTDALGNYTETEYDANDNVIKETRIDSAGEILSQTARFYDAMSREVKVEQLFNDSSDNPVGDGLVVTENVFDKNGRLVQVIEGGREGGRVTLREYNGTGRLTKVTDPAGDTTEYTYDSNGNTIQVKETYLNVLAGNKQTFVVARQYDQMNRRVATIQDPDGLNFVTSFRYDSRNNNTWSQDAEGIVTLQTFDGLNRLLTETRDAQGLGVTVVNIWDDNSRLVSKTDPNDNVTSYSYDALDRLGGVTYADGTSQTYTYDPRFRKG